MLKTFGPFKLVLASLVIGILTFAATMGVISLANRGSKTTDATVSSGNTSTQAKTRIAGTSTAATKISISAQITLIQKNTDGCYTVKFRYVIKNYSSRKIKNVAASSDLALTFAPAVFTVTNLEGDGKLALNKDSFNGKGNKTLLAGENTLKPGETSTINLSTRLCPNGSTGPFKNYVEVSGDYVSSNDGPGGPGGGDNPCTNCGGGGGDRPGDPSDEDQDGEAQDNDYVEFVLQDTTGEVKVLPKTGVDFRRPILFAVTAIFITLLMHSANVDRDKKS